MRGGRRVRGSRAGLPASQQFGLPSPHLLLIILCVRNAKLLLLAPVLHVQDGRSTRSSVLASSLQRFFCVPRHTSERATSTKPMISFCAPENSIWTRVPTPAGVHPCCTITAVAPESDLLPCQGPLTLCYMVQSKYQSHSTRQYTAIYVRE